MSFLVIIWAFLVFDSIQGNNLLTDSDGDCSITNISDTEWRSMKILKKTIEDVNIDATVFQNSSSNIESIGGCKTTHCYFDIKLEENGTLISIVSNKNLSNIDGDYRGKSRTLQVLETVQLKCKTGTRELTFKVPVNDTNNHAPTFSNSKYEYLLPMPMPSGVDLMQFGDVIAANDLDFSNTDITFEVSTPLIILTKNKPSFDQDLPYFLQKMEFTELVHFPDTTTFVITATDSGEPPRNTTVNIIFKIDQNHSAPYVPTFTQPSFLFDYDPAVPSIKPKEGSGVTLKEAKSGIICIIDGDLQKYFKLPSVNATTVTIELKQSLPDTKETVLKVELACYVAETTNSTGYTDIIISLPEQIPQDTSKFTNLVYSGSYKIENGTHEVQMEDNIEVDGSSRNLVIKVDAAFVKNFDIVSSSTANQWIVKVKTPLKSDSLESLVLSVPIELTDASSDVIDKSIILLILPNAEMGVKFTQPLITGQYSDDGSDTGKLVLNSKVELNSDYLTVESTNISGYSKFFSISSSSNTFTITVTQKLPEKIMEESQLQFTLQATVKLGSVVQNTESVILLYLSSQSTTTTEKSTSTPPHTPTQSPTGDGDECNYTVWIIVVIILCLILLLFGVCSLFVYFKVIRTSRISSPRGSHFEPNSKKSSASEGKSRDIATRRPTGYIRYNPNLVKDLTNTGDDDEELNNNTEANTSLNQPDQTFRKLSDNEKINEFQEADSNTNREAFPSENEKTVRF